MTKVIAKSKVVSVKKTLTAEKFSFTTTKEKGAKQMFSVEVEDNDAMIRVGEIFK